MMITLLKKYWLTLTGVVLGALGGYFFWLYVGCVGGTCPISSSPFLSSIWGAAIGGLLFNMFKKRDKV